MNADQIAYQLYSIDPFAEPYGLQPLQVYGNYGSGIISGHFDNRKQLFEYACVSLSPTSVIEKLMSREDLHGIWLTICMRIGVGSLIGNLCFGMLLGITGGGLLNASPARISVM